MKILNYCYLFAVAALLGVVLSGQLTLSIIFYGNYIIDWVISSLVLFATMWLGQIYWKPSNKQVHIWQLVFIPLAVFGRNLEYALYSYSEVVSIVSYLILVISGLSLVNVKFVARKINSTDVAPIVLSVSAFGLACFMGYYLDNRVWVVLLAVIALVSHLIISRENQAVLLHKAMLLMIPSLIFVYTVVDPLVIFSSQKKFHDKVIFSTTTPFQHIDVTSWKGQHWFYYNGINQFSSIDEWLYYEPMVHPAMLLVPNAKSVLVLGGENGLISRELLKYEGLKRIDLLPIDSALYNLAKRNELFTSLNLESHEDARVNLLQEQVFRFLNANRQAYDVILVDIPDPIDLEINQYFTQEFYKLCHSALKDKGVILTQAGSPYFATKAFYSINATVQSVGFETLPMHNQVLTLGEWGWVLGVKDISSDELKARVSNFDFNLVSTQWLDKEAVAMMTSFGKSQARLDTIYINTLKNPVVHKLYTNGTWKF